MMAIETGESPIETGESLIETGESLIKIGESLIAIATLISRVESPKVAAMIRMSRQSQRNEMQIVNGMALERVTLGEIEIEMEGADTMIMMAVTVM